MTNLINDSKNNNYRIVTEQINLTSNELDIKSTNEIVNIFSEADKLVLGMPNNDYIIQFSSLIRNREC